MYAVIFNSDWLPVVQGALFLLWDNAVWEGTEAEILEAQIKASQLFNLQGRYDMATWILQTDDAEAMVIRRTDDNAALIVDMSNGNLAMKGDQKPPAIYLANYENTNLPAILATFFARGTEEAPTAAISQDVVLVVAAQAHNGIGFPGDRGIIRFRASEAATGSAQGMQIEIEATPKGTTAPVSHLTLGGVANVAGVGFLGAAPVARQVVSGSRASGAALVSLLQALVNLGLITDTTTA